MPRRATILAVDDAPVNLVALEAVLEREFDLRFANSGQEAIALLEKAPDVDVILMDLQMPLMDGFEAAKRIKKLRGCSDIPIVFITAVFNEDPYVKRGYEVGGIDFFTKPFDPHLLRLKLGVYASIRHRAAVLEERERQLHEAEELMRSGRKLTAIIDSLPVGVLICDVDGRICQVTDDVSRIFKSIKILDNHAYAEILGWWNASGEPREPGAIACAVRDGESSHSRAYQIRCLDDSSKTIRASVSPLRGGSGRIVGAVIVITDWTEPKSVEAELETRLARLASAAAEEAASGALLRARER